MANSEAGTSSDAARASGGEYQVFLSFRGPDTRHGFTDFLYHGLKDVGFRVFRDEEELRVGNVIGGNLLCAINNSTIYIPIFSETYAVSKWCLRELAHIVHNVSKPEGQKSILPIFFHVEPEDVKLKTPLYSNALLQHAEKFPDEVEAWRAALEEVARIKGWNVRKDQSQREIVHSVVRKLLEKLEIRQKQVPRHLVRLDAQEKRLIKLLDINQSDVRLISISGMGGMGKTTVAKVIFNQLALHFGRRCSFLEDVRESLSTREGIVRLQKKLLSDIVDSKFAEQVEDKDQGMKRIGEALHMKEVLVVLDDVAEEQHIESLIGNYSLCPGSRIIITTRDKTIPLDDGFSGEILRYEILEMDAPLALKLFCRHAFGKDSPPDDYRWLSNEIVLNLGGFALALEVIGSSLKRRDKAIWKETLVNLKNVPKEEILKKLKVSYDGLDKNQKNIFLDIACFFFNEKKTNPVYMWDCCQLNPLGEIEVLKERCLIKIKDNEKFWMHDQLITLGKEIVCEDSLDDLKNQSRLWIAEQALEIVRTEEKKNKVQALDIDRLDDSIEITNQELEKLQNLRFLKLCDGTFIGNFVKCRSNMRWISWRCSHQDFRADNMYLHHLVVFELGANGFMDDSKAWDLIKGAKNLKVISLTECDGITTMPDFSKCLGLERLTLARCNRLKRINSFIGYLQSLIELNIEGCISLTDMPEEVGALAQLQRFSLQGCCGLSELPASFRYLTSLIELDLSGTSIAESNIRRGYDSRFLAMERTCNFRWIGMLSALKKLNLNLPNMPALRELASLPHLEELVVSERYIDLLAELPPSLTYLQIQRCTSLEGLIHPSYKKIVLVLGTRRVVGLKRAVKFASRYSGINQINHCPHLCLSISTERTYPRTKICAVYRVEIECKPRCICTAMNMKETLLIVTGRIDAAHLTDLLRKNKAMFGNYSGSRFLFLGRVWDKKPVW